MTLKRSSGIILLAMATITSCAENAGSQTAQPVEEAPATTSTESTAPPMTTPATQVPPDAEQAPTGTSQPVSSTTEAAPVTLPPPVDVEGSVQDLVAQRDDLENINEVIVAWLDDSVGREGVLRNVRGITLFLPNDDAFTDDDIATALDDFDAFTIFLSEHLRIGAVTSDELGDSVSTAMGVAYPVEPGPTIGGQTIVSADIVATNGVIHIIDGVLAPLDP